MWSVPCLFFHMRHTSLLPSLPILEPHQSIVCFPSCMQTLSFRSIIALAVSLLGAFLLSDAWPSPSPHLSLPCARYLHIYIPLILSSPQYSEVGTVRKGQFNLKWMYVYMYVYIRALINFQSTLLWVNLILTATLSGRKRFIEERSEIRKIVTSPKSHTDCKRWIEDSAKVIWLWNLVVILLHTLWSQR